MMRRDHLSLPQLIAAYIAASLLAASTFYVIDLAHFAQHDGAISFWLRLLLSFAPLVLGSYITFKISVAIEAGIAAQSWPEEKIASFRAAFTSPLWIGFNILLFIGSIALMVIGSRHLRSTTWFLLTLAQTLMRLTYPFAKNKPTPPSPLIDWQSHAPLQSQHWGNR
jgi:hypothetical protein